ncbi:hypothetical protein ACHAP8_007136 [Fusarium lateritium]
MDTERPHKPQCFGELLARPAQPITSLNPHQPPLAFDDDSLQHSYHHSRQRTRPLSFNNLPPEVRLLIWEATWPGPRLIDAQMGMLFYDNNTYERFSKLQILGSMPNWLDTGETGQVLKHDRYPVALSVCAESRTHTLKHFTLVRHHHHIEWSLYLNPTLDALYVSEPVWDLDEDDVPYRPKTLWDLNEDNIIELARGYGRQLASIKKLIMNLNLCFEIPRLRVLRILSGIEVIQLYLDNDTPSTSIAKLVKMIDDEYGKDNRYCSRFELIDRKGKVCGECQVE